MTSIGVGAKFMLLPSEGSKGQVILSIQASSVRAFHHMPFQDPGIINEATLTCKKTSKFMFFTWGPRSHELGHQVIPIPLLPISPIIATYEPPISQRAVNPRPQTLNPKP